MTVGDGRHARRSAPPTPADAAHFAKTTLRERARRGRRGRQAAPTPPSWWSAACRSSTAARRTTAPRWRSPRARRRWSRPSGRPTRTRSWCVENSYPTRSTGSRRTSRRSCGRRTPARRPATRSPTCCSATSTPPAGSPRPGTARDADLPSILDYDIIGSRPDLPVLPRHAAVRVRARPVSYTRFRYGGLRRGRASGDARPAPRSTSPTPGERAGDEVVQLYTHQRELARQARR